MRILLLNMLVFVIVSCFSEIGNAGDYQISRQPDGFFAFKTRSGTAINKGSSLARESIILNDPNCPILVIKNSMKFRFGRSDFNYNSKTEITARVPVAAVSIRHINFNLFGEHMSNLANVEAKDWGAGKHSLSGSWSAFGNAAFEHLTTVTYVSRVRLADGTQWTYDKKNLVATIGSLQLEQFVGEDKKAKSE